MTHWCYPNENPTRYDQIYAACGQYVPLREIRYQEDLITCEKCKSAMIEYESSEYEL